MLFNRLLNDLTNHKWSDLTLPTGYTGSLQYCKTGSRVSISGSFKSDSNIGTSWSGLVKLPFAPSRAQYFSGSLYENQQFYVNAENSFLYIACNTTIPANTGINCDFDYIT
jgi:hypothetical protein